MVRPGPAAGHDLERVLWQSQLWIDGVLIGTQDSLSAPHFYEIGPLAAGRHRMTLRVDNRNIHHSAVSTVSAHAYGDDTQTIWNGVVGLIELRAREQVKIGSLQVYPDAVAQQIKVVAAVSNSAEQAATATLTLDPASPAAPFKRRLIAVTAPPGASTVTAVLPMTGKIRTWDEFSPAVHRLAATLTTPRGSDSTTASFGIRDFRADGSQFTLNGRTVMLRGTHDGGAFPLTGYAPMDVPSWRKVFKVITDHGLNHYRCHSWCPPDAAFTAADEAGVMIQVELPAAFEDVSVGADADRSAFVGAELDRILDAYGNHPSFCLLSMGNELRGNSRTVATQWVAHAKQADPRHFYTVASNPEALGSFLPDPEDQYMVAHAAKVNGQRSVRRLELVADSQKPSTAPDYGYTLAGLNLPVLSHEVGQWSVYPNFREIPKYTGVLKPLNFQAFRTSLNNHGMLDQADDFVAASGQVSLRLYKEEVERSLRSPGYGGFQLLDLHDYPGQGTALIGLLDVFWQSKGIVEARDFRRFCGPVVPLLRMDSFVWHSSQTLTGTVQVANYGTADVRDRPRWTVTDDKGRVVASGRLPKATYAQGGLRDAGTFTVPLSKLEAPQQYRVEVSLDATGLSNDWSFWLYPDAVSAEPAAGVTVTTDITSTLNALSAGGSVVFLAAGQLAPNSTEPLSSTTPFWDTTLFPNEQKSLGVLCDPRHPALSGFPTESFADWQWWELLTATSKAAASRLDGTGASYRPIVQVVDHPFENRKLGAVYEFAVGRGKLLVCTLDIVSNPTGRPAAAQLLRSLLDYAAGRHFSPVTSVDTALLGSLFAEPSVSGLSGPYRLVNSASGMAAQPDGGATAAGTSITQAPVDGSDGQLWGFTPTGDGYYTLTHKSTGLLLDVTGNSSSAGAQADIWTSNGQPNQQWHVLSSGGGYSLTARSSGLNLDVSQSSSAAGAHIVQAAPSDSASQIWRLVPVS